MTTPCSPPHPVILDLIWNLRVVPVIADLIRNPEGRQGDKGEQDNTNLRPPLP